MIKANDGELPRAQRQSRRAEGGAAGARGRGLPAEEREEGAAEGAEGEGPGDRGDGGAGRAAAPQPRARRARRRAAAGVRRGAAAGVLKTLDLQLQAHAPVHAPSAAEVREGVQLAVGLHHILRIRGIGLELLAEARGAYSRRGGSASSSDADAEVVRPTTPRSAPPRLRRRRAKCTCTPPRRRHTLLPSQCLATMTRRSGSKAFHVVSSCCGRGHDGA